MRLERRTVGVSKNKGGVYSKGGGGLTRLVGVGKRKI